MNKRAWISAVAAVTVVLAGCSGDDGDDEQAGPSQGADGGQEATETPVEGSEPATPAEELRDKLHAADPVLCGTTGDEAVEFPEADRSASNPAWAEFGVVASTSCSFIAYDPDVAASDPIGTDSLEGAGDFRFESYATITDAGSGWSVVVDDQATDPLAVQDVVGGDIHTWLSADAPQNFTEASLRRIQEIQHVDRCATDEETDPLELVTREDNRSESLDVDSCKLYAMSPALSDEEVEQIKAEAVAEAEAGDYGLFWGDYLVADPNLFQKYPWLAESEGHVPGYLLVRDDSPQALEPELAGIGVFELLVP